MYGLCGPFQRHFYPAVLFLLVYYLLRRFLPLFIFQNVLVVILFSIVIFTHQSCHFVCTLSCQSLTLILLLCNVATQHYSLPILISKWYVFPSVFCLLLLQLMLCAVASLDNFLFTNFSCQYFTQAVFCVKYRALLLVHFHFF